MLCRNQCPDFDFHLSTEPFMEIWGASFTNRKSSLHNTGNGRTSGGIAWSPLEFNCQALNVLLTQAHMFVDGSRTLINR
jgi:hypothetical protein